MNGCLLYQHLEAAGVCVQVVRPSDGHSSSKESSTTTVVAIKGIIVVRVVRGEV